MSAAAPRCLACLVARAVYGEGRAVQRLACTWGLRLTGRRECLQGRRNIVHDSGVDGVGVVLQDLLGLNDHVGMDADEFVVRGMGGQDRALARSGVADLGVHVWDVQRDADVADIRGEVHGE